MAPAVCCLEDYHLHSPHVPPPWGLNRRRKNEESNDDSYEAFYQ